MSVTVCLHFGRSIREKSFIVVFICTQIYLGGCSVNFLLNWRVGCLEMV